MDAHKSAVSRIAADVRRFYDKKQQFRIYHGSTNSTRTLNLQKEQMIDTSRLNHVIKVDASQKTVLVEPNVPMDQLVEATLPFGLVPPVVMEFPGITVGGGFAGTSGESSSFKYGFFDRTVNWIEAILANGEQVVASSSNNSDLFYGSAGSFGTISVVTLLELRLIEARKYVELTYFPIHSISEAIRVMETEVENPSNDYVDGIMLSLESGLIITGHLTDDPLDGSRIQRFSQASDPWFYRHAQSLFKKSPQSPSTEAVPLVDYLFRYDRGAFWTGKYAMQYFSVPFNRLTRFLLDSFMHTRVMYHALHESGHAKRYIIQDLALPQRTTAEFVEFVDEEFGFYPLWLCPLHKNHGEISLHPHTSTPETRKDLLINVGVWGPGPSNCMAFVKANRKLEMKVRELSGMKWLYAHAYYTEDEFWSIYNKSWYDELREKYHASHLPSVYDKVKVDLSKEKPESFIWSVWPLSGLYGVIKMLLGSNYVLVNEHRISRGLKLAFLAAVMFYIYSLGIHESLE